MGEFIGLAAQILIFFAFTPVFVLSVVGGRVIDRRRADRNRRATMRRLGIDDVRWQQVGIVTIDGSGDLRMPALPRTPGLLRLEFVGPRKGQRHVKIAAARDLHGLWVNSPPGRRFGEHYMRSHLKQGGTVEVSYVDSIVSSNGTFDFSDTTNRERALAVLRQDVEILASRGSIWSLTSGK